ncbi:MAG: hypothetical protein IKB88_02425 [Clostridia bacterium]|nr:hypothetical protein [Clostridia bacterium]
MKKSFKKLIALILCAAMLVSVASIGSFAAEEPGTECNGECEYYPTVIIPGLGQSSVCVTDDEGNFLLNKDGKKISAFPAYIQIGDIIKKAAVPLILSLLTQKDIGLSNALKEVIRSCFGINQADLNAQIVTNVKVEKFPYSFAECSEYEMSIINSHIPFNKYDTDLPYDHLYYFSYNSFGNHIQMANELYDYIQMVKEQTGHDKVNIVPISQGGTIASAMFEYRPEIYDDLHKVIFIVPCLDGSRIIGDVFNDRITFTNADYLYNGFLEESRLLDRNTARLIEVVARILPDDVLVGALSGAVDVLVNEIMTRSTSMWAMCPSADYPTASEKYLSSPDRAKIKEQTDKYYNAQLHCKANIQKLVDNGIQVFNVAQYNYAMINVGENWNTENADYIIQLDSTSMGAHAANCGETLPEGYKQANTSPNCSDPTHNHISPDNVVDASTGLLPDHTWYFEGQRHDLTQHNNIILETAFYLIAHDDVTDVYSDPRFPQFNKGRDVRIIESAIEQAKAVDTSTLSAADADALKNALAVAEATLADTSSTNLDKACEDLTAVLVKIGVMEAVDTSDNIFTKISPFLFSLFGPNGFSEMPGIIIDTVIKPLFSSASSILSR